MPPSVSSLPFIAISLALLLSHSALGAVTTQTHRQDLKNLPSPLPANRAANQANMKIELSPIKRSVGSDLLANSTARTAQKKRFKTSGKAQASASHHLEASSSGSSSSGSNIESSTSGRTRELWRNDNDLNNNSIPSDDNNNNQAAPVWRRNVDSINGTVDLSQYERNDIDRLYDDALLVYFKNFNESLPARRELISINGTISSAPLGARNRIPIYRSVPTNESK